MKLNSLFILFICLLVCTVDIRAQDNNEYQIANRLIQQQRYEDAIPILERVIRNEPSVFIYFEKLIECHSQLKQYDKAIQLIKTNVNKKLHIGQSSVHLGNLYHLNGDTTLAYSTWKDNLAQFPNQLQLYLSTATSMMERKEFKKAIEVYKLGRITFNNELLFMSEIPNAYMQEGNYEDAVSEWLTLIEKNPRQTSGIQRLLLRYNDPILYDITIIELEDKIESLVISSPAYSSFYEFQIWLLLENKLFRRAFSTAKEYEEKTSNFNFALFNVGRKLAENKEFELSISAYDYYIEDSFGEIKWRAKEEKAHVYTLWAKHLDDYSLDFSNTKDDLFNSAVEILDDLIEETYTYSRIEQVYLKRAELALDFVFDLEAAKNATKRLKSLPNMFDTPEANYLEGRISLAQQQFTNARIELTRGNKKAEIGELAEKTRYFLALTDFYAGDFEFAKIQLKTLGRQNTSYYANDALELRLWVQEGISADTTGETLKDFAEAHYKLSVGKKEEAKKHLLAITNSETPTPFQDDAYIILSKLMDKSSDEYLITINSYIENSPFLSMKERLLWERAKAADEAYDAIQKYESLSDKEGYEPLTFDVNIEEVTTHYEQLILEFPQGFYAPYARKRLSELPKPNS